MGQLQIGGSGYFEGGHPSLSYFYLWQELGREVRAPGEGGRRGPGLVYGFFMFSLRPEGGGRVFQGG